MSVVERIEKYTSRERERLDRGDAPAMGHTRDFSPNRTLCGAERDPSRPTTWGFPDCVVCMEMWSSMSDVMRIELIRRYA